MGIPQRPMIDPFAMSYRDPQIMPSEPVPVTSLSEPFMGRARVELYDVDHVDAMAGIQPYPGAPVLPVQNIESDLRYLRSEMPSLEITKFPKLTSSIFLATANLAADLNVPDGCVLVRFRGTIANDYWVSHDGRAVAPSAAIPPAEGSIYKPEFTWFYVGGIKSFSVISNVANTFVQLIGIAPNNWGKGEFGRGI